MKDASPTRPCSCALIPLTRENFQDFTGGDYSGEPRRLRGMSRHAPDHCCVGYCRVCAMTPVTSSEA